MSTFVKLVSFALLAIIIKETVLRPTMTMTTKTEPITEESLEVKYKGEFRATLPVSCLFIPFEHPSGGE